MEGSEVHGKFSGNSNCYSYGKFMVAMRLKDSSIENCMFLVKKIGFITMPLSYKNDREW